MKWFEKFIGCAFGISDNNGNCEGEYIFQGTFSNTETKSGLPLQYVFEAEGKPQILIAYKEARRIMGTMIEKYSVRKGNGNGD